MLASLNLGGWVYRPAAETAGLAYLEPIDKVIPKNYQLRMRNLRDSLKGYRPMTPVGAK
jgi:hypothetical protein